ncbi:MAG: YggT family protein [Parasphingopyxis sp.]|nr:YggT family protein [Sphingomonadales bacterium]
MLYGLLGAISVLITVVIWMIIIQAILSWLVAFNVINTYNEGVRKFLYWLDRLTDPLYRPVRAIMPDFGGIDFSPIVVILVLYLIQGLLLDLQLQTVAL